jgi:hypothetical protein
MKRKITNSIQALGIAAVCAMASWQYAAAQNNVGNFYVGEVKVEVVKSYNGTQILTPTKKVLIQNFTVDPAVVSLDESKAGRIHTRVFLHLDPDDPSVPEAVAKQVQASFSKALAKNLKKSKVEAQSATGDAGGSNEPELVISGEFTSIDQGNKAKRVMVGLGRGATCVQTHVIVSSVVNGESTVVLELNLKSASGKKLGAVESVGGGSIAVNAAEGAAEDKSSTVQGDASRMAKGVSKQIEKFMIAQNWIPAPATPVASTSQAPPSNF